MTGGHDEPWTSSRAEVVPTRSIWIGLCVAILLAGGCTDEAAEPSASPPAQAEEPACPNQDNVVTDPDLRIGGAESADVDGDGTADDIVLHVDGKAEIGCQAFLSIDTGSERIAGPVWAIGPSGGLPQPSLFAVLDLDGDGVYEIVVNEAMGASTQFVAAYAVSNAQLVALEVPNSEGGLFPYGGSVGHIDASDCAGNGRVVVSQALPGGGADAVEQAIYDVTRRFYSVDAEGLQEEETKRAEVSIEDLSRFSEFSGAPFGSCETAP